MRWIASVIAVFLIAIGVGTAITVSVRADPRDNEHPVGLDNRPLPTPRVENPESDVTDAFAPVTSEELAEFTALIKRDRDLAPMLRGTEPQLSSVGAWTEGNERIGVGAVVTLPASEKVGPRAWRVLRQDDQRKSEAQYLSRGYATREVTIELSELTQVMVMVDLRNKEVVSVRPHEFGTAQVVE
jgi:hypothetical protein